MEMKVIIESPFKGKGNCFGGEKIEEYKNRSYLQECIRDCFDREEFPFASHQMYTDALDDNNTVQRYLGIAAGFLWGECADKIVVYYDRGISRGMKLGIQRYSMNKLVEFRSLYEW